MKKILLSTILSFSFLTQSNAQVSFGIKGGAGVSPLNYNITYYNSYSPSYERVPKPKKSFLLVPSLYGIVSIPVSKSFAIFTGIGLDQQAYSYMEIKTSDEDYLLFIHNKDAVTCRLNYLEIPLYMSWKLPFAKRKFDLFAGGSFGINLGGTARIHRRSTYYNIEGWPSELYDSQYDNVEVHRGRIPRNEYSSTFNYDQGIYAKKFNASALFGINYQLSKHILLGLEAQLGLTNIVAGCYLVRGDSEENLHYGIVRTQSYMFTVTYILAQGKKNN